MKGFNGEYLLKQKKYYTSLRDKSCSEMYDYYDDIVSRYDFLFFSYLMRDGVISYDKFDTKMFLELFCNYDYKLSMDYINVIEEMMNYERPGENFYKEKIMIKKSVDIIGEFIKEQFELDSFYYFDQMFMKNRNYILFSKDDCAKTVQSVPNELFIIIPRTNDIKMVSVIAHEFGHAYGMFKRNKFFQESIFLEFESFTYEVRLLCWMINNNIYREEAKKCLKNSLRIIEQAAIGRYIINSYRLLNIKDPFLFEEQIKNLDLFNILNVKAYSDIYDILSTGLCDDYLSYFYSYLYVLLDLDNGNFLGNYYKILESLCVKSDEFIKNEILKQEFSYDGVLKLRKIIE